MLELKFAIYYRAASLPSQASYAVLAEESQAFFRHSPHTNSISNSAILRNNYIWLLSDLCACVHVKKNGVVKEAIVLQWAVRIASRIFKPGKKRWASALLSDKFLRNKTTWFHECVDIYTSLWGISQPNREETLEATKAKKLKSTTIVDSKKHCQWRRVWAVKSGSIPLAKRFPRKSGARM